MRAFENVDINTGCAVCIMTILIVRQPHLSDICICVSARSNVSTSPAFQLAPVPLYYN